MGCVDVAHCEWSTHDDRESSAIDDLDSRRISTCLRIQVRPTTELSLMVDSESAKIKRGQCGMKVQPSDPSSQSASCR